MAIMESQRHIIETGGYGRPVNDGDDGENGEEEEGVGVSDHAKKRFKYFQYSPQEKEYKQEIESMNDITHGNNVKEIKCTKRMEQKQAQKHIFKKMDDDSSKSCCVCLSDYEAGEFVCQLPCGHVYHSSCITSWCAHHVTCPLCNFDLERGCTTEEEEEENHDDAAGDGNSTNCT